MKYIKLFERDILFPKKYVYWKLSTKRPDFLIQMWKIGMSDKMIKRFEDLITTNKDIYMFYKGLEVDKNKENFNWFWRNTAADFAAQYKFLGSVDITNKDIEEYELEQDLKKYNL